MNRYLVGFVGSIAMACVASGCADERHLTVRGEIVVEDTRVDFRSMFDFANAIRLDEPSSAITGSCIVSRNPDGEDDRASVSIQQSDQPGIRNVRIEAVGDTATLEVATTSTSTYTGSCALDMPVIDGSTVVLPIESGACTITTPTNDMASVELFLELHGCQQN